MDQSQKRSTPAKVVVYSVAVGVLVAASGAGTYSPGAGCNIRDAVKICSERSHVPVGHVQPEPGPNYATSTGSGFAWLDMTKVASATAT
jgi:hypothetical protein